MSDLIDRQAIDEIKEIMTDISGNSVYVARMSYIRAIPSVTLTERTERTGHWSRKTKVDAYDIAGVKTWGIKCQCDRCDFTTIVVEDFGYYNYCPNCGCRMVEPKESEEV